MCIEIRWFRGREDDGEREGDNREKVKNGESNMEKNDEGKKRKTWKTIIENRQMVRKIRGKREKMGKVRKREERFTSWPIETN